MIYVPSRVKRHKYKFSMDIGLNLVSLMDIFTILLLFLLIHVSGEAEEIPLPEVVSLPLSTSTARHEPTTTVYITTDEILVDSKKVASARDVLASSEISIDSLESALRSQPMNVDNGDRVRGAVLALSEAKKVIIMGDKAIPFALFKKVMYSCAKAGYPVITLAVIQKGET